MQSNLVYGEICLTKMTKIVILPYFPFKKFHPRMNLTTLLFTKTYLPKMIKQFLGHETWPLGPKLHNLKKPL
jgi:hypothetical protein